MSGWSRCCRLLLVLAAAAGCGTSGAKLVSVQKIWDQAPHNAFTDLVRFQDRWYCTFREGDGHVSSDGSVRVITSADGEDWSSAVHMQPEPGNDLRDPKLTVTPDGRLMLTAAERGSLGGEQESYNPWVSFSKDGKEWTPREPVGEPDFWLWRVTWHEGAGYGVGYTTRESYSHRNSQEEFARLYKTADGVRFETHVNVFFSRGYPNESAIVFRKDGTAVCLLRRDGKTDNSAQVGVSEPPYTLWNWKDLGQRIGGPNLISLPDGRLVASGRLYLPDGDRRTLLWSLDPEAGTVSELLRLPSGGDTSYAGMAWHEGLLWMSYYSTHEEKTSIYLAKVDIPKPEPVEVSGY